MKPIFRKRVFTLGQFLNMLFQAIIRLPILVAALIKPKTSPQLREQVMLACTSVNDCRYCAWAHTHLALKNGVDIEAMNALLASSDNPLGGEQEGIAILFAQHFAEFKGRPSGDAVARLQSVYSKAQVKEIYAYLYAIYFANLSGNTFDALLARLRGQKVENSYIFTEVISSALSWPILVFIMWRSKNDRRIGLGSL
ncbi:MAG: carboxymuconolactone decarboxylase family protein [Thalassolituus sp.]|jgi:AhpD family alkylhydroperoxidase|uniref:Carboxymuconolactone decarboxylase-like domain-containing protein n=2 Tax=root TaxID=1 RepID=M5DVY0_9GAMM|nr:carboxymuconolactone decarboxylase family protein [Thalassolituus oleivorans]AHK14931.1 hypothetical protein R615_02405 [Thalassolituus oleivorans R6-15]APR66008.1 hypothetical protein CN03_03135 [Thalassolituus oleivorans]MBQ0728122.1 carboxymuconolactone decarboxylase family protein [Thalassolituus oleivorans]MCA6128020.1 hypothetical protein [Thalassolituus oleivorans 4BN06-13]MDF1642524.1 carboxymuconolactone decarboxylase family protein [Thalassolituus oleivorans]